MISRLVASTLFVACVSSVTVACSSSDPAPSGSSGPGGGPTACESDTRKDVYVAGLSRAATDVTVKLVDAKPAPLVKGSNELMVQVLDAGGKPVDGATLTFTPFMPDHGHGSSAKPEITPMGSDGKYQIKNIWLPMAGLWKLTFGVTTPGAAAPQDVSFSFCLDG